MQYLWVVYMSELSHESHPPFWLAAVSTFSFSNQVTATARRLCKAGSVTRVLLDITDWLEKIHRDAQVNNIKLNKRSNDSSIKHIISSAAV